MPKHNTIKGGAIALSAAAILAMGAGALSASAGPTIPSAVTITVAKTHVAPSATIPLRTFGGKASQSYSAVFTGDVMTRSTSGNSSGVEFTNCSLTVGSPARVVGSAAQAGTGALLGSGSAYPTTSMAISGTFTANPGETLALTCTSTGQDAIINEGHVVISTVVSQVGGV
jgi:hypothetical protein